jgi:acyl transferase domain-containing protein
MGRELYRTQPVFQQALDRCAEILRPHLAEPLLAVMWGEGADPALLDQTGYTQPALFALEVALAELWRSWGVTPTWVLGHSVGEVVAAVVAGVLTLEDGGTLIATRARLMQALPPDGAMVAVAAPAAQVQAACAPVAAEVSLAAVNGPASVVISGRRPAVAQVVQTLTAAGVRTTPLAVSHAFHSPLIEPMLGELEQWRLVWIIRHLDLAGVKSDGSWRKPGDRRRLLAPARAGAGAVSAGNRDADCTGLRDLRRDQSDRS